VDIQVQEVMYMIVVVMDSMAMELLEVGEVTRILAGE
jgi:hypothetical protein